MFVEDYTTADPVTIHEDAPVVEAARWMRQHGFRQLPVLDEGRRLAGITPDRDIRQTADDRHLPLLEGALNELRRKRFSRSRRLAGEGDWNGSDEDDGRHRPTARHRRLHRWRAFG